MADTHDPARPVTRGDVDALTERDRAWRELGLGAPARRALVNAGILTPEDLRGHTAREILALHGIGRSALPRLAPFLEDAEQGDPSSRR